jgi:hypothetical protein
MESSMLGITLRDLKTNQWIGSKTNVQGIVHYAKHSKWRWAGHIARCNGGRWTKLVTEWRPFDGKSGRGRPVRRGRDEIFMMVRKHWIRRAQQIIEWNALWEIFFLRWTENG